ncbi:hypothetical protein PFISCL1PPCAC_20806, partial [Pristionchus fissidentatus]
FSQDLSAPFIESGNERIVSIVIQSRVDGLYEIIALGEKGSLVRCTETRDGTADVESITAAERPSPLLSYRTLTQISCGDVTHPPLIVAYTTNGESTELCLLSSESSEQLMSIQ